MLGGTFHLFCLDIRTSPEHPFMLWKLGIIPNYQQVKTKDYYQGTSSIFASNSLHIMTQIANTHITMTSGIPPVSSRCLRVRWLSSWQSTKHRHEPW